jgi:superfamily I DNA/RNA helicase
MVTLSKAQRESVEAPHGPSQKLLVIAPAGSGKTEVLARRAVRIAIELYDMGRRESVLCLCFGKDAQVELCERIRTIVVQQQRAGQLVCPATGYPGVDASHVFILVRTLNSLGLHIVKKIATEVERREICGLEVQNGRKLVSIAGNSVKNGLLQASLIEAGVSLPSSNDATGRSQLKSLLYKYGKLIAEHKTATSDWECARDDNMNDSDERCREFVTLKGQDLRVFQLYVGRMLGDNLIDYQDMLGQSVKLVKKSERIAEALSSRFAALLVDEAQDLSTTDLTLALRLGCGNVTLVGDDDQSIYGFRSGVKNWQSLMQMIRMWPSMRVLNLPENQRCPASVVHFSSAVIEQNKIRIAKDIVPGRVGKSPAVRIVGAASANLEISYIAKSIRKIMANNPLTRFADIVLLGRKNHDLNVMAAGLREVRQFFSTMEPISGCVPRQYLSNQLRFFSSFILSCV